VALWNNRIKIRTLSPAVTSYYLLAVLVLCKSIASLFYGVFVFFLLKMTKVKMQFRVAVLLATLALLYPAMSIMNVFPHQTISNIATSFDKERAQSLTFRFDNEKVLLDHARDRFFFGSGGWGRNRVHNNETGKDETVTDGRWIITFGTFGILGFIAEFGLLALSVFRAKQAAKFIKDKQQKTLLAAHALLVSIIMVDQIPNASLAPWLWLITGILLGCSERIIADSKVKTVAKMESKV